MAGLEEIGGAITDREAFKAALRQSSRNIPFFVAMVYIVTFLPDLLGIIGVFIEAGAALTMIIFVGKALFSVALGLASVSVWGFYTITKKASRMTLEPGWAVLSMVLRIFDASVYAGCFYFMAQSGGWWGPF